MADSIETHPAEDGPYRVSRTGEDGLVRETTVLFPQDGETVIDEPALDDNGRWRSQKIYEVGTDSLPEPEPEPDLQELTVPELREKAEQDGVDLTGVTKKADITAKINKAQEGQK